jgi:PPOX class probable F420-dependent enzyme
MAATSKDGPELHPATVELAQGKNYGAITTVLPSGRLQTHPIWVGTDGERLVVNTETHRQKYKNVERDPTVTLTIRDEENPYRYAEVRGEVVEKMGGKKPGITSTNSRRSTTAKTTHPRASRASG